MLIKPLIWQHALTLRGSFASQYLKYHGPTDADAGITLVKLACTFGYSSRDRAILGKTLRDWQTSRAVPQWAAKTMIRFVCENGYIPTDLAELDAMVAHLVVDLESADLSELVQLLVNYFPHVDAELLHDSLISVSAQLR